MKSETKRIIEELKMLQKNGVKLSRELVLTVTSFNSYWYIVFANTNNFLDSMNELMIEAA